MTPQTPKKPNFAEEAVTTWEIVFKKIKITERERSGLVSVIDDFLKLRDAESQQMVKNLEFELEQVKKNFAFISKEDFHAMRIASKEKKKKLIARISQLEGTLKKIKPIYIQAYEKFIWPLEINQALDEIEKVLAPSPAKEEKK
jgi:hypothetical protein